MLRCYGLDIQTDIYAFAVFLYMLVTDDEGFASMPWETRAERMWQDYQISVSSETLRKWCSKLIESNSVTKDNNEKTYWTTTYYKGKKEQDWLPKGKDSPEWKAYWKAFWEMKDAGETNICGKLYEKLKFCAYSCPTFVFSAWDDTGMLMEIIELVNEITWETIGNPNAP